MNGSKFLICSLPSSTIEGYCIVTVDYDIYQYNKDRIPNLDCICFYNNKDLHWEWSKALDCYARDLGKLVVGKEKDSSVGALCGSMLYSGITQFLPSLAGFHAFVEKHPGGFYILDPSLHPVLVLFYQDIVLSYGGVLAASPKPNLGKFRAPLVHGILNTWVARALNFLSKPVREGGILFWRHSPPASFIEFCKRSNIAVYIANPSPSIFSRFFWDRWLGFFFVFLPKVKRNHEFNKRAFQIGRLDVTNSMGALARDVLKQYLGPCQSLKEVLEQWIRRVKPSLAFIGESESPIAHIIHEACQSLGSETIHIPHGLLGPWLGLPSIEGISNSDVIFCHCDEMRQFYQRHSSLKKETLGSFRGSVPRPLNVKKDSNGEKAALVLEYGLAELLPGESDWWYYQFAVDLIERHLDRFPNRKILFRARPFFFQRPSFFKQLLRCQSMTEFIKKRWFNSKSQCAIGGELYFEKQKRMVEYMRHALPSDSFEMDTSPTFADALSRADYVIGNFSTCYLEAMQRRKPYYCYNPGNLDYPVLLDCSKEHVFRDAQQLVEAIDKIAFDEVFQKYNPAVTDDKQIYQDYILMRSLRESSCPREPVLLEAGKK